MADLRERLPPTVATGAPAPDFAAVSISGDTVRLRDYLGEVVLVNAWATWCKPCVEELPLLESLHERFASEGLRVVGINIEHMDAEELGAAMRSHGLSYENLRGRQWDLERALGWGRGIPRSLLVDRSGRVALVMVGGISADDLDARRALSDTIRVLLDP